MRTGNELVGMEGHGLASVPVSMMSPKRKLLCAPVASSSSQRWKIILHGHRRHCKEMAAFGLCSSTRDKRRIDNCPFQFRESQ